MGLSHNLLRMRTSSQEEEEGEGGGWGWSGVRGGGRGGD